MVYNSKTYQICHKLTKKGEVAYRKMLEKAADEILFKHQHPFKWFFQKINELFFKK